MNGTSGMVGTELVNYTYAGNVLTANGPRGVLFTVTVTPATGAYTVTAGRQRPACLGRQ